jgi:tetratricopeptide (TPR) repeat protein/predicted Zn-dependent protease
MKIIRIYTILLIIFLLLSIGCKEEKLIVVKLPKIEPMSFEVPKELREFYEKFHKKGEEEFTFEEFFGENVKIPRPTFEKEIRLKDKKKLIEVKTSLGKFEEADKLLKTYLSEMKNSPEALEFAGFYYLGRNRVNDGLQYLLKRAEGGKEPLYWLDLIRISKEHNLKGRKYEFLEQLIEEFPDSSVFYKKRHDELKGDKKDEELAKELRIFYKRFPEEKRYFLQEMEALLLEKNQAKKAIDLYLREVDPIEDVYAVSDFFALLDREKKLRKFRKEWKGKKDRKSILLLFQVNLNRGNWEGAEDAIVKFVKRFPNETYLVGRLYKRLGYPRKAYEYYQKTLAEKGESEELLFDIFTLLTDESLGSVSYKTRTSTDVLFSFDKNPGVTGGFFSLYYNTMDYERRESDFENVKGKVINLSFSYEFFSYILKKYPNVTEIDSLYVLMIKQFQRHHIFEKVIEIGEEYKKKKRKEKYAPIYEAIATAHYALGNKKKGNDVYRELLSKLTEEKKVDEYHVVFQRFVSHLISQKDYSQCTKLYWEEIKKHPKDRQLYERFLSLIYNYNLYHEELKVYKYAVEHFDEKTWYHKMARWYIRHKSEKEFRAQTEKIKKIFNDRELEQYLEEFVFFDSRKSFSDPGNRFYLAMYKYGMKRFPENINYAKGLIRFYSTSSFWNEKELVKLYKVYFFYDDDIRTKFLRYLSSKQKLREYLERARKKNGICYTLFTVKAYEHFSLYENTEEPLQYLTILYPEKMEFADQLANLYRSIDYSYYFEKRELTEKGVGVFLRTIDIFPTVDTLYTQLGEMLVEASRYEEAKEEWMKRIDLYPGMETPYLNVATILWDYYDFEDAVTVVNKGRSVFLNDTLFSKEMAVLYEELDDYENAVKEYISASLSGEYYYYEMEEVLSRLIYLKKMYNLGKLIEESFIRAVQKSDTPDKVVQVYSEYLDRLGLFERKLDMYGEVLPLLDDPYYIREILYELEASEREYLIINYAKRLVDVTGEIDDYLILASTYENMKKLSDAKSVFKELLTMFDDEKYEKRNILRSYSEFLWRNKEEGKALDILFDAQSLSEGYQRESILHTIAFRAVSIEDFKRAKKAFTMLLEENPYNTNYFNLVGDMYEKLGDAKELENVYVEKIKQVDKSPLGYSRKRSITKELYVGLARRLKKLDENARAVDYYIEAINRSPQNYSLLDEVYTFSKKAELTDRLISYYKKTAEKSFKDYRWQMILYRLYLREGDIASAITEIQKAVENQPQKAYLHEELADRLAMEGRYSESIAEYETAYKLTKTKNEITRKIALIYLRQEKKENMFGKFDELIASKPKGAQKYFDVARICLTYGLVDEAFKYAEKGKTEMETYPYEGYLSDNMLSTMAESYLRSGRANELIRFLCMQYMNYSRDSKKEGSYQRSEASTRKSRIRYFISGNLVSLWKDFSTEGDREELVDTYNFFTQYKYNSDIIQALTQFFTGGELPDLTEKLLLWRYGEEKRLTKYPSQYRVTEFYSKRGAFNKLYGFLRTESDNYTQLAQLSRIVAPADELSWLKEYYQQGKKSYYKSSRTFSSTSPLIERYLDVLFQKDMKSTISQITRTPSVYNGQILNYFVRKNNGDLAFNMIEGGFPSKNVLWKKSKKAYISFFLDFRRSQGKSFFGEVLDIRTIGEKIDKRNSSILTGNDFYVNCFFYGKEDPSYLFARIEASPRNSRNYRHLANYYYDIGEYESARDFLLKALSLSSNYDMYMDLSKIYLALGDKRKALDALKNLDGDDFYSKERYINALVETGFAREARKELSLYLKEEMENLYYGDIKRALGLIQKTYERSEDILKELSKNVRKNESFYSHVLKQRNLKDRIFFIKRYLSIIEKGREKKDFYRRDNFIKELMEDGKYKDALELVSDTEKGVSQDSLPYWFVPRKAEILVELNKKREGIKLLTDYVESKKYLSNSTDILYVLNKAGKEGFDLKRRIYEKLISGGNTYSTNYLGLAESYIQLRKGDEALYILNELAIKVNYAVYELNEIARLLCKFKMYDDSQVYIDKVLRINPGNLEARLLRAKVLALKGETGKASLIAVDIVKGRNRKVLKEKACEIIEVCGERAMSALDDALRDEPTEDLYLAKARLLKSLKKNDHAVRTLEECYSKFRYSSSRLPLLLSEITSGEVRIKYLYESLYRKGSSDEIVVKLIMDLMKERRDMESKELIGKTRISPSNYLGWYDREEAKRNYIQNVETLIPREDKETQISDSEIIEILMEVVQFFERIEDLRSAQFILESILTVKEEKDIEKRLKSVNERIGEVELEEKSIIKESLSNGETL